MTMQMRIPAVLSEPSSAGENDPIRASRRRRIRTLQLYLKQIRASDGSWTDGRRVFAGQDLEDLRHRLLHQAIQTRSAEPVSSNGQAWQRLAPLLLLAGGAQAAPLFDRLVLQLRRAAQDEDPRAQARARILRRALRRKARRQFEALPIEVRTTPKETAYLMAAVLQAMMGRSTATPLMAVAFGVEAAAGSFLGESLMSRDNPFEYSPEEEVRRGLRPSLTDRHSSGDAK